MELGISDDYAVLYGKGFKFYYGYEETDSQDNWQFIAEYGTERYNCLASDLGKEQFDPPEEVLLLGIGRFLEITGNTKSKMSKEALWTL